MHLSRSSGGQEMHLSRSSVAQEYVPRSSGGPEYAQRSSGGQEYNPRSSGGQEHLPRSGRATPTYESLGRRSSDYEYLPYGPRAPLPAPPVAPRPRLSAVEEDSGPGPPHKRAPPPLPPKPQRVPPPLPPHAHHLHSNFGKSPEAPEFGGPVPVEGPPDLPVGVTRTKSGLYLGLPGEKGYNVSFV